MRFDMAKVIVERPRYRSSLPAQKKGYLKMLQSRPMEESPRREPMLGRWQGMGRYLNEHLGPMRRFLRSQVGRPWNKIHQELCENISFDNAVQKHVLAHIGDFVQQNVKCQHGRLMSFGHYGRARPLYAGEMYVCPATGLLKIAKPSKRRSQPRKLLHSDGGRGAVCLRRDGRWYSVRLQSLPPDGSSRWDVWLNQHVSLSDMQICTQTYEERSFALSVTAITQTEVRRLLRQHFDISRQKKRRRIAIDDYERRAGAQSPARRLCLRLGPIAGVRERP